MTPEERAAIRARHEEFAARYSPGPDWEPANRAHSDRGALLDHAAAADAEVGRLRRALNQYGEHMAECAKVYPTRSPRDACSCGLDAALAGPTP